MAAVLLRPPGEKTSPPPLRPRRSRRSRPCGQIRPSEARWATDQASGDTPLASGICTSLSIATGSLRLTSCVSMLTTKEECDAHFSLFAADVRNAWQDEVSNEMRTTAALAISRSTQHFEACRDAAEGRFPRAMQSRPHAKLEHVYSAPLRRARPRGGDDDQAGFEGSTPIKRWSKCDMTQSKPASASFVKAVKPKQTLTQIISDTLGTFSVCELPDVLE